MIGFFNCLKPTGSSSTFIVSKIKRATREKRVGHLGTLDPAASGVLPVAVGKATKFFDYFLNKDKVYFAVAEFGVETDSLDSEGNVLKTQQTQISRAKIQSVLSDFVGEINQIPPVFSAVKIDGKKAYELARAGKNVEIKSRTVHVYSIELIEDVRENAFSFRVHCSAGTYIRTLLVDIAHKLGEIANVPVIIREKSGPFEIKNAATIDQIQNNPENYLISVENVFGHLKRVDFVEGDIKKVINGVSVSALNYALAKNQEFLGYVGGKLFGLFESDGLYLKCKVNLFEGE
ncbi:MAG: tRNA pseudouridine(55) synthase TruB [Clostridia bacterium]|nr:tRNA pseudouridine(55) synthase TruB [Clostridia bacterium]